MLVGVENSISGVWSGWNRWDEDEEGEEGGDFHSEKSVVVAGED